MGTESLIINSEYNRNTKNNLDKIFIAYINKFLNLNVLVKVEGIGQSKYRFKNEFWIIVFVYFYTKFGSKILPNLEVKSYQIRNQCYYKGTLEVW